MFDFGSNVQAPNFSSAFQNTGQGISTLGQTLGGGAQALIQKAQKQKKQKEMFNQLSQIPELAQLAGPLSQNPELLGQLGPALLKPQKPQMEWSPISGMMSKSGRPMEIDKTTGEIREAGPQGTQSTGYGTTRMKQFTMQDLPSNQPSSTSGGAAYQVKVAARQGKSLVGKAGSAQRTGLATGDLARAILRAAPTDEAMQHANFSDNLVTRWSLLKQKVTADPNSVNNPQVRKEMYSIFDEMDKAAEPWIKNQLDEMKDQGFPISENTYKRQLGLNIPDIPFIELPGGQPSKNPAPGAGKASLRWNPQTQQLEPVQ